MKIAICYYGTPGWVPIIRSNGELTRAIPDLNLCLTSLLDYLGLQRSDVDIFAHCWGVEHKQLIQKTYSPIDCIIEKQVDFTNEASRTPTPNLNTLSDILRSIKEKLNISANYGSFNDRFRVWSRFYSQKKVVNLKQTYESKNNFKYDLVILLRYDLIFQTKQNLHKFKDKKLHLADTHDIFRQRFNYIVLNELEFKKKYKLKKYPLVRKVLSRMKLNQNIHFMQHNIRHILLSYLRITSLSVSDLVFIGTSQQIDVLGNTISELHNYYPCAHIATWQQISKFIGLRSVCFSFRQFKDFEILRQTNKYQIPYPKGLPNDISYETILKPTK